MTASNRVGRIHSLLFPRSLFSLLIKDKHCIVYAPMCNMYWMQISCDKHQEMQFYKWRFNLISEGEQSWNNRFIEVTQSKWIMLTQHASHVLCNLNAAAWPFKVSNGNCIFQNNCNEALEWSKEWLIWAYFR